MSSRKDKYAEQVFEWLVLYNCPPETARIMVTQMVKSERRRAAWIVKNWPVDSPYIVGRMKQESRQIAIAEAIMGDGIPEGK